MVRKKQRTRIIIYSVIGVGVVISLLVAGYFLLIPQAPIQPTIAETSSKIIDGNLQIELDDRDFVGVLYETDDINDFLDYDVLANFSTGGVSITDSDIDDQEKAYLVLVLNGTVPHDEDMYADDLGPRIYYKRFILITPLTENIITVYQKPSSAGITAVNSQTFLWLNVTDGISTDYNFTIIMSTNASEPDAVYVRQFDYENQLDLTVNILVELNDTVTTLNDFSISGMDKSRFNSSAIVFDVTEFESLGPEPSSFQCYWSGSASNLEVNKITLRYGEEILATI